MAAPILKCVPCLRSVQDKNVTLRIPEVISVSLGYKRPIDPGHGLRLGARREQ
jgi:hypothetical protein